MVLKGTVNTLVCYGLDGDVNLTWDTAKYKWFILPCLNQTELMLNPINIRTTVKEKTIRTCSI